MSVGEVRGNVEAGAELLDRFATEEQAVFKGMFTATAAVYAAHQGVKNLLDSITGLKGFLQEAAQIQQGGVERLDESIGHIASVAEGSDTLENVVGSLSRVKGEVEEKVVPGLAGFEGRLDEVHAYLGDVANKIWDLSFDYMEAMSVPEHAAQTAAIERDNIQAYVERL